MFERAKDMDDLVRAELYQRLLSEPSLLENMEIESIIEFLCVGFKERNEKVKKAFLHLVYQAWISDEEKIFEVRARCFRILLLTHYSSSMKSIGALRVHY